ncbi:MAG: CHAT domain-containing protein [Bacteroidaceae bacterium]|nr:CHAT domain-containing protein [Bacteroidaceae bacterium]
MKHIAIKFIVVFILCCSGIFAQTNEHNILHGIELCKQGKYNVGLFYLPSIKEEKDIPTQIKLRGEFYLQYAYYFSNDKRFSLNQLDSICEIYVPNDSVDLNLPRTIAYNLSKKGNYAMALKYGKITTKWNELVYGKKSIQYAYALDNLSIRYTDINEYDSAMICAKKANNIIGRTIGINNIDYVKSLNNIADIYLCTRKYSKSIKYFEKGLEIIERNNLQNDVMYPILLDNLSILYFNNIDKEKGIYYNEKALNLYYKDTLSSDYVTTLSNLGTKYSAIGKHEDAIKCYLKALSITMKIKGPETYECINAYRKLASSYLKLGDYQKYLDLSMSSLSIMNKKGINNSYYIQELVDNMIDYEDYINAKSLLEQLLEKDYCSQQDSIKYLRNLSYCCYDNMEALKYMNICVNVANRYYDLDSDDGLLAFTTIASDYCICLIKTFENRNIAEALKYMQNLLMYREMILSDTHPLYISSLLNVMYYSAFFKISEISDKLEEKANNILMKEISNDDRINLLSKLSILYYYKKDYAQTVHYGEEALSYCNKFTKNATYEDCLHNLLLAYIKREEHHNISRIITKIWKQLDKKHSVLYWISQTEKKNYWEKENYNRVLPEIYYLANKYPQIKEYIQWAYDGLLRSKNCDHIILGNNKKIKQTFRQLRIISEKTNRIIDRGDIGNEEYKKIIKTKEALEREINKNATLWGLNVDENQLMDITWSDVKSKLGKNDIAIEFMDNAAILLKYDWNSPKLIHISYPRNFVNNIDSLKCYSDLIWKPIKDYLNNIENIYFSTSHILHKIPIESLPINDKYIMSDIFNMHRLSSTRELLSESQNIKYTTAVLYGGLDYDMSDEKMLIESNKYYSYFTDKKAFISRGLLNDSIRGYLWNTLSNTENEVTYISQLLQKYDISTIVYKGISGNEESFKNLSGNKYDIIHIATHGFFYPNEEAKKKDYYRLFMKNDIKSFSNDIDFSMWRSGLVLSGGNRAWKGDTIPDQVEDGILKAQEISDLDLRGADLVVLSACQTGLGEITSDGVFGLQRAFKMAGAQTIVMSLTEVDDQTTMAMMNKFYTNLFSGQSKHDAFYNAQRYIRSIKPNPKYWAGWIMLD